MNIKFPALLGLGTNGRAYLFLTITTLCWGANTVFGRLAVGEVSPMILVSLRWTLVMVLLFFIARKRLYRDWHILRPRLGYIMAMGTLGYTAFNALFYAAAHSTTALNMGIIQGGMPAMVLLGSLLFFKTPVTLTQVIGTVVTLSGVVLVASGGSLERLASLAINHGDFLLLIASALYAGYAVALRKKPDVDALSFFFIMAFAAFLSSLPLAAGEIYLGNAIMPSAKGWILIVAIALLPSFLSQLFFMFGVQLIGPGRAGVWINLVPIFASLMAVVFLGEPFHWYHGIALALVLGGIWLAERKKKPVKSSVLP